MEGGKPILGTQEFLIKRVKDEIGEL